MPPVVRLFVRTALVSFVLGVVMGVGMMIYKALTGLSAPYPFITIHTHILMVGWLTNMVMGVAYWMFPRPQGRVSRDGLALGGFWSLNGGLLLRVLAEPALAYYGGPVPAIALGLSGLLQGVGALIFVFNIWRRVTSPREEWERRMRRE